MLEKYNLLNNHVDRNFAEEIKTIFSEQERIKRIKIIEDIEQEIRDVFTTNLNIKIELEVLSPETRQDIYTLDELKKIVLHTDPERAARAASDKLDDALSGTLVMSEQNLLFMLNILREEKHDLTKKLLSFFPQEEETDDGTSPETI